MSRLPPGITRAWLDAATPRIVDYSFTDEGRDGPSTPLAERPESTKVSKNYVYWKFGIPSVTYEVGDETDRKAIKESAVIFAEELMRVMLAMPTD